jgi:hypothetical protein
MHRGRRALGRPQHAFAWTFLQPAPLLAAIALAALTACAEGPIDPPQLDLITGPYVPVDPLARDPNAPVVVRNGKGEIVAEMQPGTSGDASANPPLSAFDGTFVVETKRNDGTTERQQVTYPAGQPVKLRRDPATGRYVAEAPEPRIALPTVSGSFTYFNLDRPNTNLFRREDGGVIRGSAIQESNKGDGVGGAIEAEIPIRFGTNLLSKGSQAFVGLTASYGESNVSSAIGDVPANGDLFGIFTPGNGIVTGQDLRDATYSSNFHQSMFGADLRKNYKVHGDIILRSAAGLNYGRQSVEEHFSARTSISNTLIDHLQDTDSTFLGFPLSTSVWVNPFPGNRDVWLTAGGNLEPRYHKGETDWRVSATGLADRTETLKDTSWTLGGGIHIGGYFGDPLNLGAKGYPLTAGFKVGMQWAATPQVEYKDLSRGDGGATLEHKTSEAAYGMMTFLFKF